VNRDRRDLHTGAGRDIGYRADLSYAVSPSALIEGGGNVTRTGESASGQNVFDESGTAFGGYTQVRLSPLPRVAIVSGARIDRWATVPRTDVSPWLNTEWKVTDAARLVAGIGVHRQAPRFAHVFGVYRNANVVPETAKHVDLALEHTLGAQLHVRLGGYARREREVIDLVDGQFRMVADRITPPAPNTMFGNLYDGRARGVELSFHRTAATGISGWVAYAFGKVEYTDRRTGDRFPGDFDERHNVSANATWRLSNRTSVTTKFRASSNFPVPGYLRQQEESFGGGGFLGPLTMKAYYLAERRNQVRLPAYSRLDVRANRTYTWQQRRLTLFVEVTNIYNRANQRYTGGDINGRTGRVSDLTEEMFPIMPSAGLLIEF
jgi:outer membrane receptor for ferrienterochelin and colicin